jgi:hypothetical protein
MSGVEGLDVLTSEEKRHLAVALKGLNLDDGVVLLAHFIQELPQPATDGGVGRLSGLTRDAHDIRIPNQGNIRQADADELVRCFGGIVREIAAMYFERSLTQDRLEPFRCDLPRVCGYKKARVCEKRRQFRRQGRCAPNIADLWGRQDHDREEGACPRH